MPARTSPGETPTRPPIWADQAYLQQRDRAQRIRLACSRWGDGPRWGGVVSHRSTGAGGRLARSQALQVRRGAGTVKEDEHRKG